MALKMSSAGMAALSDATWALLNHSGCRIPHLQAGASKGSGSGDWRRTEMLSWICRCSSVEVVSAEEVGIETDKLRERSSGTVDGGAFSSSHHCWSWEIRTFSEEGIESSVGEGYIAVRRSMAES